MKMENFVIYSLPNSDSEESFEEFYSPEMRRKIVLETLYDMMMMRNKSLEHIQMFSTIDSRYENYPEMKQTASEIIVNLENVVKEIDDIFIHWQSTNPIIYKDFQSMYVNGKD